MRLTRVMVQGQSLMVMVVVLSATTTLPLMVCVPGGHTVVYSATISVMVVVFEPMPVCARAAPARERTAAVVARSCILVTATGGKREIDRG